MSIMVFWIQRNPTEFLPNWSEPKCKQFSDIQLSEALTFCNAQRNAGHQHVVISSENSDSIGKLGVDSVENGKTPDGEDYTWMKRRSQ